MRFVLDSVQPVMTAPYVVFPQGGSRRLYEQVSIDNIVPESPGVM